MYLTTEEIREICQHYKGNLRRLIGLLITPEEMELTFDGDNWDLCRLPEFGALPEGTVMYRPAWDARQLMFLVMIYCPNFRLVLSGSSVDFCRLYDLHECVKRNLIQKAES